MVPILNTAAIKALDRYTIDHVPIASIDLMERACRAFARWFDERFPPGKEVSVVCGPGNNGGDGLGIARLLAEKGHKMSVILIAAGEPSADFKTNLSRLPQHVKRVEIGKGEAVPDIKADIIIDGLFGSGLSRPVDGIFAAAIDRMNAAMATRVAIDIPSGLKADEASSGTIFQAHHTVTFQLPKLSFLLPDSCSHTGEWHVVDIGLDREFIERQEVRHFLIERDDIRKLLKSRTRFQHKGDFGKALLVCGSHGKMGAAVLAARAAIRVGAGLVTTHIPACGYTTLQSAVPEAMVDADPDMNAFTRAPDTSSYSAVGTGPGLGTARQTGRALASLLEHFGRPMVIDADAINIVAEDSALTHLLPAGSILTPHPGEFRRLVGEWKSGFERLEKQVSLAASTRTYVLVKGAYSAIATPEGKIFFNPTGNPGMATGGSGDVLTGILTGLLAQSYSPLDTALIGVYLHGLAGDLAALSNGVESLIASDITAFLPAAFAAVRNIS